MARASLKKEAGEVASMFDGVARRYDRTNTLMTGGLDRYWRRRTRQLLELKPGEKVLDLAAGTGVSTVELARSGAWAAACDFSTGMLHAGAFRPVPMVAGDAMALPFADDSFDAATISFGLRNVQDTAAGLREMARVVRPGGRLVVCEFSTPTNGAFRALYENVALQAIQVVARGSSNPEAYTYLAESIKSWPDQAALARIIEESGWGRVRWTNLTGGIVALHSAVRPLG
ncbi:Demethylmenaquinone methyltransferase OS=Tsukamurella paurometabola (strain ATCC 8368 / DSM/ CCUG 35730 / CIP 100753 / JCM 10117 / KCTC 9821 / NBRC 16120/ NCIMB 702349 / NCTC 13040) OX=521096 GN=menG PE=3 SV=1 [Tsukamurella paurometabola]|uniref:Demethylmenaquinone methyltransferase n=1 Tax=Tsukamurella paurometabola (strain ATCC 8368 / DSM 20162 / CCUG 35730 / CIP 100753 / JCM 10117 / KCTC 9821 / NBRC 16120 / NCIMB 702349 / NCTC 13040) TaxID=521096 RepID=D5UTL5_TSUPD|nr:demethylmenaquinone methyltransferase [Tsukamurella paurometabola]ADG77369.1 ubiquinone/menaquinone biosynthesis methyltransferase [Tsukamurella paurometabola DSM 20162]SUP26725.1 Ubiquinone/menaquinone biosynthesis methyltransferase ubiE [Tsukamurella paurometabola]